jgi:hypothetical protein
MENVNSQNVIKKNMEIRTKFSAVRNQKIPINGRNHRMDLATRKQNTRTLSGMDIMCDIGSQIA